ncbi:MAG: alpha-ketoglutarate-dependent dioxygenase AlkB [Alphaproteobacteria bacterium]|nr:alpha-ketoglutarate-dependent dioxygenase AlkB [Alphaproteobacteria bacterium]
MKHQPDLFGQADPALPEGLVYRPNFVTVEEEAALIGHLAALPLEPFQFHGFKGNRRTVSFGMEYKFDGSGLRQTEPFPDWLLSIRDRAAALAALMPEAFVHALIIEYGPGAGIGWHRDRPVFGDVVGVSLGSEAPLRFRLKECATWRRLTVPAKPRSAYLLRGPARTEREHSIAPVSALRYSITLRTLRPA